ncbi:TPA: hypothetical protein ACOJM5_001823 [Pseudomonas putida]
MRYNTGNPVEPDGSGSAFDLYDNSANFDVWANDRSKTAWPDRLGVSRKTWHGMEQQVNDWLAAQGFEPVPLVYVDGSPLTVERPTQLIERDENLYSVRLPASFPVSLSGSWSTDEPLLVAQVDRSLREELANGSPYLVDSGIVGYRGRNLREVLDDTVHCVDGSLLQGLINDFKVVRIPHHAVLTSPGITIPNDRVLIVDGKLQLAANSPDGTKLITSASATPSNISIYGDGELDGNKANQSGASTKHTLVFFQDGDEISYQVRRARGNYFPRAIPSSDTTGMIYLKNCTNSNISNARGYDYGRECFWMQNCTNSEMCSLKAFGGADSWSGFQFSGDYNKACMWHSISAGASGGSFDCRYSTISHVHVENARFQHGFNFGHAGFPADGSTASHITVIGGSKEGTANACNGLNVAASTNGLRLSSIVVRGAPDNGINISDGSNNVSLVGFEATNNGISGVRLFGASSVRHKICGGGSRANVYGLSIDGGMTLDSTSVDLRGNASGSFTVSGSSIYNFVQTRLGDDALSGTQLIAGLGAGGTVAVSNTNVRPGSKISLTPGNLAGASALPVLMSIGEGTFTIQTVNSGAGGAQVRWVID